MTEPRTPRALLFLYNMALPLPKKDLWIFRNILAEPRTQKNIRKPIFSTPKFSGHVLLF